MRKRLLSVVLAVLMITEILSVITLPTFAWNWKDNGKFEVASYNAAIVSTGSIKVDAEIEDVYLSGTMITSYPDEAPYKRSGYESVWDDADGSFTAYVAMDTTGMFIYAEIADTTIFETLDKDANSGDGFEIYLDWVSDDKAHPSPEEMYEMYLADGKGFDYSIYRNQNGTTGSQGLGWISGDYRGNVTSAWGFTPHAALGPDGKDSVKYTSKLIEGGWACEWFIPWRDQTQKDMIANGEQFHCSIGFQCADDSDINNLIDEKEMNVGLRFDQRKEIGLSYYANYHSLSDLVFVDTVCTNKNGHSWKSVKTVAATCTEDGYTNFKCEWCKKTKTEYEEASHKYAYDEASGSYICSVCKGVCAHAEYTSGICVECGMQCEHSNVTTTKYAATCTSKGYTLTTCNTCGNQEKTDFIAANPKAHSYVTITNTTSTCVKQGEVVRRCRYCNVTTTTLRPLIKHTWVVDTSKTVEPKCNDYFDENDPKGAYGELHFYCKTCNGSKVYDINPASHVYVLMDAVADDCDTVGHNKGYFCKYCFAPQSASDIVTDNIRHNWTLKADAPYLAATCEKDGYQTVYCTICKQTKEQTLPALGHEHGDRPSVSVKPTCTKYGYDYYGCVYCGMSETVNYAPIGHKFDKLTGNIEPTCTTPGGFHYACSNEGCQETQIVINNQKPALGHGKLMEIAAVEATCTESGITAGKKCTVCMAFVEGGVTVPALGCDKVTYICSVKGIKDVVCTRCGRIFEEGTAAPETTAESHVYVKTGTIAEPTCTSGGTDSLTCKYCGKNTTVSIPKLNHVTNTQTVKPTCTQSGYEITSCKLCGKTISQTVLPANANAHTGTIVESVAPTCTAAGYQIGECIKCGASFRKELPALGHDVVEIAAVPATCTTAGNTAGAYCRRGDCGAIITESVAINALGHKTTSLKGYAATCYKDGLSTGKQCTACGVITSPQVKIPAYDHTKGGVQYSSTVNTVASCKGTGQAGYTIHNCAYCDEGYVDSYVPAPAHSMSAWKKQTANCTREGYSYRVCSACGYTLIDEKTIIKPLGHKFSDDVCTVCGKEKGREIVHTDSVLGVDGILDSIYLESDPIKSVYKIRDTANTDLGFKGYAVSTKEGIYIWMGIHGDTTYVSDESVNVNSYGGANRDYMQVYYNMSKANQKDHIGYVMIDYNNSTYFRTQAGDVQTGYSAVVPAGFKSAAMKTSDGWVAEMFIPWYSGTPTYDAMQSGDLLNAAFLVGFQYNDDYDGTGGYNCAVYDKNTTSYWSDYLLMPESYFIAHEHNKVDGVCTSCQLEKGKCGENLTWEINKANNTLTISGSGKLTVDPDTGLVPWNGYASVIEKIKLSSGITDIFDNAFSSLTKVKSIVFCGTKAEWNAVQKGNDWNKGIACDVSIHNYKDGICLECGSKEPTAMVGDANGDNKINNGDALMMFRYIYNKDLYPIANFEAADVNSDGKITNGDILAIFRYIYNSDLYPLVPETLIEKAQKLMKVSSTEFAVDYAWSSNPVDYKGTGAKVWATNDANGLYVYAEIDDATPTADNDNNIDNGDLLKVYLDVARDSAELGKTGAEYKQTGTSGSMRLGYVNITPDGKVGGNWGYKDVEGIKGMAKITDNGYQAALYIPLDPDVVPEDKTIGLAFEFHDDIDNDNKRDAIFVINENAFDYWNAYEATPDFKLK